MKCAKCLGKRHVWSKKEGKWEPCRCLLLEERNSHLLAAGIPKYYWDLGVNDLSGVTSETKVVKNFVSKVAGLFKKGQYPDRSVIIQAPIASAKVLLFVMMRYALTSFTAKCVSLDELTSIFLKNDKTEFVTIRGVQVLGLSFGDEYTQQIHRYLLNHLAEHRADPRFFTIWATHINQRGMYEIYGTQMSWIDSAVRLKLTEKLLI